MWLGGKVPTIVDTSPVVELGITDPAATRDGIKVLLQNPQNMLHCPICCMGGEEVGLVVSEHGWHYRILEGNRRASRFHLNVFNIKGCFFYFSDLSIKVVVQYKLKFSFMCLSLHSVLESKHECRSPLVL